MPAKEVNIESLSTDALGKLNQAILAELASRRDRRKELDKKFIVHSWIAQVFEHLKVKEVPEYWVRSRGAKEVTRLRNACLAAETFLQGLGDFDFEQQDKLRELTVSAVIHHQRECGYPLDAVNVVCALHFPEAAFSSQLPGYLEGGMIRFVLNSH